MCFFSTRRRTSTAHCDLMQRIKSYLVGGRYMFDMRLTQWLMGRSAESEFCALISINKSRTIVLLQ